jgi:formiminotetrahydrofolate cyclodeaminase
MTAAGDALAGLLERPLGEVLDDVSRQQFPAAGGTSAALSAALGAALTCMVARSVRTTWDGAGGAIAQSEALRTRLCALAATDADAYARARDLLRRAGQDREHRGVAKAPGVPTPDAAQRDEELAEALEVAAAMPLAIAEAAAEVAELAAVMVAEGGADERPDAVVAALLAEAAARGAAGLVLVNLAILEHDEWAVRARAATDAAAASRARALPSA